MDKFHHGCRTDQIDGYAVLDCEECGFKHLDPIPTSDVLNVFYEKQYYQSHKSSYILQDDMDRKYLEISFDERIRNFMQLTQGRKILDIGCGAGMFLEYAFKMGWQCQGVEPSLSAYEVATSKGLDIFNGSIEEFFSLDKRVFDVIYLKNVLEHVPDPRSILDVCRNRLAENGVLFVEVPNDYEWMQKLGIRVLKEKKSWLTAPDHINYFNFKSLDMLVRKTRLKPVKRSTTFPIYGLLMFGCNFIGSKASGRKAHQLRMSFEIFFEKLGIRWLKNLFYTLLAYSGSGRTVIYYCVIKN